MNERIRELALQVGAGTPQSLYGRTDYIVMTEFELEKFAELIVRKYVNIIGEENYTMLTGKAYCVQLKRHFGVEE